MRKAIKRIASRIFIFILVILAIYLVISNIERIRDLAGEEKVQVLIDADAANGVDDLLSIPGLMESENLEVRGLCSAQWRLADLDNDSTIRMNREIHRFLLEHYHRTHIPHPDGPGVPLAYLQDANGKEYAVSMAIRKAVQELPYGEKLQLICMGSATNLAKAILDYPEISERIVCHIQGPYYDPSRRAWNKNDRITRLDLDAMDVLLNEKRLEIQLLPSNVAEELVLDRSETLERVDTLDTLSRFIRERLCAYPSESDSIPMGSLALVQAFLNPDMGTRKQLITPPENNPRKIYVYIRIDPVRMTRDLYKTQAIFRKDTGRGHRQIP